MATESQQIERAVEILRRGGVVAFPTETVYGLGADARSSPAARRIFQIKGRPATNPLIVHVSGESMARRYAADWPDAASQLARAFWPGPLTLVLPKQRSIVDEVSAGRATVGLRAPDHALALDLIERFNGPLCGPSANRSTRVSPTTADHVRTELGEAIDFILDGGACRLGIESTVLNLSSDKPVILRPGGVGRSAIEAIIGPVKQSSGAVDLSDSPEGAVSPGQHAVHYSPVAQAYRFEASHRNLVQLFLRQQPARPITMLVFDTTDVPPVDANIVLMPQDAAGYAHRLYAELHEADDRASAVILIEMPPDGAEWDAVRDRLTRAARILPGA